MKQYENLGKKIGRSQQKEIKGGGARALFNLTCYNAGGGTFIGSYSTVSACFTAMASACNPAIYDNCTCSGPGGGSALCF